MGRPRGHCENDLLGGLAMEDYCVFCGNPVPEGQMVCYECLHKYGLEQPPAQRARRGRRFTMPPRGRNRLYSQAERSFRDAIITFENGNMIEIPEICAMSVEPDELDDMPIASAGAQEATFSIGGVDLIEHAAERRREAERQTLEAAFNRTSAEIRDAIDSLSSAAQLCASSFMESLNSVWGAMSDGFELADEEEYVVTDPISFDELMGGTGCDN